METKTWPYGTTRRASVISVSPQCLTLEDDQGEGHILVGTGHSPDLKPDDRGIITIPLPQSSNPPTLPHHDD